MIILVDFIIQIINKEFLKNTLVLIVYFLFQL